MTKATTINEICEDLAEVFKKLKSGEMEPKYAVEINNTAGKIIGAMKVQLAYHALRGESPNIAFLASPDAVLLLETPLVATAALAAGRKTPMVN